MLFRLLKNTVLRLIFGTTLPLAGFCADSPDRVCDSVPEDPSPVLAPEGATPVRLLEFGKLFSTRIGGKGATEEDRARLIALFETDPGAESLLPFVLSSLGEPPAASKDFPRLVRLACKNPSASLLNLTLGELLLAPPKTKETVSEKNQRLTQAHELLSAAFRRLVQNPEAEKKEPDRKMRHAAMKFLMASLLLGKEKDFAASVRYLNSVPAYHGDPELSAMILLMILDRMEKTRPVSPLPGIGPIPDKAFSLRRDFSEAYPHFLSLLETGRFTDCRSPVQLCTILAQKGRVRELRRALLSWALLTGGTRSEPLSILAALEETAGHPVTAGRLVELALETGKVPDPVPLVLAAVNSYREAGALDRALALLKKYESRFPDKTVAAVNYMQIHLLRHDIRSALKAAAALPENHAKYIQIMLMWKELKEWRPAAEAGEKALRLIRGKKLTLHENVFYLVYAEILEKLGDLEGVRALLEPLIQDDPENADLLNFLGYVLADHDRELDYAQKLIERALKKKPDNAAILDSMAWVLYRKGKFKEAERFMRKSLKQSGDQPDATILDHAGDIYQALGDGKKASGFWRRALRLLEETGADPELEKAVRKKCPKAD